MAGTTVKELAILIRLKADGAQKGFRKFRRRFRSMKNDVIRGARSMKRAIFSIQGAVLGMGAAMGLKRLGASFINAASTMEQARISMRFMIGDAKKAGDLMQYLRKHASEVPHTLQDIVRAAAQMTTVFRDNTAATKAYMPFLADTASYLQAITLGQIDYLGAARDLRKGITEGAGKMRRVHMQGAKSALGLSEALRKAGLNAKQTREILLKMWTDAKKGWFGFTDEMKESFTGRISMMQDAWFNFRVAVMDTGLFDYLKFGVTDSTEKMKDLQKSAKKVGDTIKVVGFSALEGFGYVASGAKVAWVAVVNLGNLLNKFRRNSSAIMAFWSETVEKVGEDLMTNKGFWREWGLGIKKYFGEATKGWDKSSKQLNAQVEWVKEFNEEMGKGAYPHAAIMNWIEKIRNGQNKATESTRSHIAEAKRLADVFAEMPGSVDKTNKKLLNTFKSLLRIGTQYVHQVIDILLDKTEKWEHALAKATMHLAVDIIKAGVVAAISKAAGGAVWQGGFTPMAAFAGGGVVNRPTFGLIGEKRKREAIIPMPNGAVEAIIKEPAPPPPAERPVQVTVNIDAKMLEGKDASKILEQQVDTITSIVRRAMKQNPRGYRTK